METNPSTEGRGLTAPVTLFLITCMLLATLPALSFPKVDKLFNPSNAQSYPWQFLTGAFIHGWAYLPPLPHLIANLAVFFFVGPWTERLLGSARYLLMMLVAILAAGLVRSLPGYGPLGASAFILACGPVLLYRWVAIRNQPGRPAFQKAWLGLLVVGLMIGMPLVYGAWLARQSAQPALALLQANAVHLTAFITGGAAVWLWRARLNAPATAGQPDRATRLDRAAVIAAGLMPAAMAVLIILGALKKI